MKEAIIRILKENEEEFISGQEISNKLNVSRTAIWKYIKLLKEEGYNIDSVSRKGYRLLSSPDIVTYEEIKPFLNTKNIGKKIIHFDSINSTNIKGKALADNGEEEGVVVIAEEQTGGKGRLGRNWVSPKGKGIWMSIILRPNIDPMDATKITQIAAASVYTGLEEIGIESHIKWPNDIVLNGKKICGILTEMSGEMIKINYLVVGIGINANIDYNDFPKEVREKATSIKEELGKEVSRKQIIGNILNNFEKLYNEFLEKGNIESSIKICRDRSILIGKKIKIISKGKEIERLAVDITDTGELIVKDNLGEITKIISGEVSVRGINGYV
ncbi:bifunctional ligase/repressor BirA [Gottschalkia purinilytica]|uniref:Bifunctional ligase/repressor BirA n=1 Tax=Gottschalkia purinilytica TaxID=1503 RepID=A0A0L0W8C1_GOTPU|nr:biotin--[acetyl-CoA-carboxylase] ligase [Gottschalkia purinilytica]KNF07823.1 bifunctional ligase/repressor BirA [Gottschalkia purinilytica]